MSHLTFIIKSAFEDFRRNKIRTFLTSLGILIGVSSVVLLIALGLGLRKYISNQFESLGSNLLIVMPGNITNFSSRSSFVGGTKFDEKDVTTIKKIKGIKYIAPISIKSVKAQSGGNSESCSLYGTTEDVFAVINLQSDKGRNFTKSDVDKKAKIVVLGSKVAEKVFNNADNAIDKTIKIDSQSYKVVGVAKQKGGGLGGSDTDNVIYVPYKSALSFNPDKSFYSIYLKAEDGVSLTDIKLETRNSLLKRYKEDEFSVVEATEILSVVNSIFSVLNMILVSIAAISLIVGGIGIMNIMYVSVVERIREIGIRRAIGATARDILFQFLTEAVALSLLGGFLGLLLSFLVVLIIQNFFPAYISLESVLIAIGVSSIIGVVFGVFPAKKAADLSPIDAIRYE